MSMHKIPLTTAELNGLTAHGLDIGKPSQLSDVFRQGVAWGQKEGVAVAANWLRRNANAESDPGKRAAFIEAHNAMRVIERGDSVTEELCPPGTLGLTSDQKKEYATAAEPLIAWLAKYCHPHMTVIVTGTHAELLEGQMTHGTDAHIRD